MVRDTVPKLHVLLVQLPLTELHGVWFRVAGLPIAVHAVCWASQSYSAAWTAPVLVVLKFFIAVHRVSVAGPDSVSGEVAVKFHFCTLLGSVSPTPRPRATVRPARLSRF